MTMLRLCLKIFAVNSTQALHVIGKEIWNLILSAPNGAKQGLAAVVSEVKWKQLTSSERSQLEKHLAEAWQR